MMKCPQPGLHDLRARGDGGGSQAPRPKRKRRRKKVARSTLDRFTSSATASTTETTFPADDIERESAPDATLTGRDVERE